MEPKYPLEKVHIIARDGDVVLGESRAKRIVLDLVSGYVAALEFARALLASIERVHFQGTVTLDEPPHRGVFDVYVLPLTAALIDKYGLQHSPVWYVKLKVVESEDGGTITCVSMHPAENSPPKPRGKR